MTTDSRMASSRSRADSVEAPARAAFQRWPPSRETPSAHRRDRRCHTGREVTSGEAGRQRNGGDDRESSLGRVRESPASGLIFSFPPNESNNSIQRLASGDPLPALAAIAS